MISAAERPMPWLEPVMTATWPERSKGSSWRCAASLPYTLTCCQGRGPRLGSLDHSAGTRAPTTRSAMGEERLWEKSYPPGVRWDAPIETATLPALFDAFTDKWAAKPALEYRDRKTSYRRAARRRRGRRFRPDGSGRRPGHAVALYLPNTPYHPISFFAALKAGARIVHLSPLDAERELAFKLKDSGARVLVTTNIGFMAAAGAEAAARRAGRPSDRRRRHGLRPVGHTRRRRSQPMRRPRALRQAARRRRQQAAARNGRR